MLKTADLRSRFVRTDICVEHSDSILRVHCVAFLPILAVMRAVSSESSVQGIAPGDLPPVPRFDAEASCEASFSPHLARESIQASLFQYYEDNEDRGKNGASIPVNRPRPVTGVKGARKRKARPTRSDDGCEIHPRRHPPSISTDQLFYSLISQVSVHPHSVPETGAAEGSTSHGMTRQQAILAGERRRQQGVPKKVKWYKHRAAIVSGVLVHLSPITTASAGSGSRGTLLMGPRQTDIAV